MFFRKKLLVSVSDFVFSVFIGEEDEVFVRDDGKEEGEDLFAFFGKEDDEAIGEKEDEVFVRDDGKGGGEDLFVFVGKEDVEVNIGK